jgi:hypothetical protein
MLVFQTLGEPPSCGNTILVTIGCTRNRRLALRNSVAIKPSSSRIR